MKIPVWFASAFVGGLFIIATAAFEHNASQTQKLRDDVDQLKVDVAVIKARIAPDLPHNQTAMIP